MWIKWNIHPLLVGIQAWEIRVIIPQKGPALPSLGKVCFVLQQRHFPNHVHCTSFHNKQKLEKAEVSISQLMDKENLVTLHNVILCSH